MPIQVKLGDPAGGTIILNTTDDLDGTQASAFVLASISRALWAIHEDLKVIIEREYGC